MKKGFSKHVYLWAYGVSTVLACTIAVLITFYNAYLNNYRLCIMVNKFGEFRPEVFMILIGLIVFIYEMIRTFKLHTI